MTDRKRGRPHKADPAWEMLSVRCPVPLIDRLVARTAALQRTRPGITQADVVREAIALGLEEPEPPEPDL